MKNISRPLVSCTFIVAALLGAFAPITTYAAVISWDTPTDYSAPSDVRVDGVLVEAFNLTGADGAASPTVNGVTFVANTTILSDDATTDFLDGDTGDVAYNQLLNSLDFGSTSSFQFGGGKLEAGKDYLIQAWYVDERSSADARAMQFGDGNGNLSAEVNDQYVVGTFTANDTNQTITIAGTSSGPHFTAYQIRDLSSAISTLSTSAGETVSASFTVSVGFSESITGLTANDFSTVNCSISNFSGSGASWSFTVNPIINGDLQVTLPADSVIDSQSHGNAVSNTIFTTYVAPGSEQPIPTLSSTATDVTGDYTVNIDFSEPVTGLELSDFVVTSATISDLSGSGDSYTLVVSPNFGGDVTISLPRNSVTDIDGDTLKNVASNELVNAYFITVTVNTPGELLPYLVQDNITATLAAGTYTITAADVNSTYGTPRFEFWGSNSTYDFTDVTINFAADIYDSGLSMSHIQIFGNNNVLKNLSMIDLCDKYGTAGKNGGVNIVIDGENNRVEGFYLEIRGSYPYGYGDCFGKGGPYTIKHWKHSGILVRGNYNHLLNCTLMQESYGHCIFMQAASNPTIEGCYVEAETRTTDEMLAETSGPAFDIDFLTVWGFTLPAGYTKATCEAGIRAYNAGNTYVNGVWYSRGTSNPTILDNTLVNTRTGVTLTHASGTKYVSGCTTIGTERGYAIGSGIIENCYSDVKHGPAFGVDYDSDSGITADITIIPHEGTHYNGSRHVAYITGKNHNITFRGEVQNPELDLEVNMGGDRRIESSYDVVDDYLADNIIINNLSGYPLVLDDNSDGNSGQSIGTVTDNGTANNITPKTWAVAENLAFYGVATQSDNSYSTIASFATDQNTNGDFSDGSVTHTSNLIQPWWRVDLEGTFDISEIKIWNRTDSNQSRLSNFDVTLFDENEQLVWTNYQANAPDPSVSFIPNESGRYVLIQLRGTNPLSLAEVEIFGAEFTGPTNLVAAPGANEIDLSWDAASGATSYTVKRSTTAGGPYANLGTTTNVSYTDNTALIATTYYYIVTATLNSLESDPSNEASGFFGIVKIPVSSGDITASGYQDGSTHIPSNTNDGDLGTRWSAQSTVEEPTQWIRFDLGSLKNVNFLKIAWHNGGQRVASFEIEVSNDGSTWTSVTGGIVGSSGTTTQLEAVDVTDTQARYVRYVGHGNSSGNGWNSVTEIEIWGSDVPPPPVPVDLAATPGDVEVSLTWTVSTGATQHHLKRSITDGSGYSTIASVAGGSYVDVSVINGTFYYYVVSAENGSGESSDSEQVTSKPYAPIASEELVAPMMTRSGNSLDLSIESIPGRIYQLQKTESLANPADWEDIGGPVTGSGGSITLTDPDADSSLIPERFYRVKVLP